MIYRATASTCFRTSRRNARRRLVRSSSDSAATTRLKLSSGNFESIGTSPLPRRITASTISPLRKRCWKRIVLRRQDLRQQILQQQLPEPAAHLRRLEDILELPDILAHLQHLLARLSPAGPTAVPRALSSPASTPSTATPSAAPRSDSATASGRARRCVVSDSAASYSASAPSRRTAARAGPAATPTPAARPRPPAPPAGRQQVLPVSHRSLATAAIACRLPLGP